MRHDFLDLHPKDLEVQSIKVMNLYPVNSGEIGVPVRLLEGHLTTLTRLSVSQHLGERSGSSRVRRDPVMKCQ